MFPHSEDRPSRCPDLPCLTAIPVSVLRQLRQPILPVGLRGSRVPRAAVPEASIHEDGDARTGKHDVDSDALDAPMQTETKSFGVQRGPERALGRRMLASDSAHELRAGHRPRAICRSFGYTLHFFVFFALAVFARSGTIEIFDPLVSGLSANRCLILALIF